jgi:hypothetical protein
MNALQKEEGVKLYRYLQSIHLAVADFLRENP